MGGKKCLYNFQVAGAHLHFNFPPRSYFINDEIYLATTSKHICV